MQKCMGNRRKADLFETANAGIDATEEFLKSLEIPMTLSEVGITEEHFTEMAEHAVIFGGLSEAICSAESRRCCEYYRMCM